MLLLFLLDGSGGVCVELERFIHIVARTELYLDVLQVGMPMELLHFIYT